MEELEQPPTVADQPGSTPASPGVGDRDLEDGASSPETLDAVGTGTPEATAESVEHAQAGEHHEAFLGLDSYGWVAVAFLIFAALMIFRFKVPGAIAGALDARAVRIRGELDEARRLREEAEGLLAEHQARLAQAERDAETIRAQAHDEAAAIVAAAGREADARIARRTRMAEDRIAAAERAAEGELRARAADLATEAARRVILAEAGPELQQRLTARSIEELSGRLA